MAYSVYTFKKNHVFPRYKNCLNSLDPIINAENNLRYLSADAKIDNIQRIVIPLYI